MAKRTYPANKQGLPFGSFIRTGGGFVARVAGTSNRNTTMAEVYGYGLDLGDVYTNGCTVSGLEVDGCTIITKEVFRQEAVALGHDPTNPRNERLRQWDDEQGTWR